MNVTFSVWNGGTLVTEYQLELNESDIESTHIDASSVWDEFAVVAEWGDGQTAVIEPYTYSNNILNSLQNG